MSVAVMARAKENLTRSREDSVSDGDVVSGGKSEDAGCEVVAEEGILEGARILFASVIRPNGNHTITNITPINKSIPNVTKRKMLNHMRMLKTGKELKM